jgi:two-component system, NarL family, invasion response regulator UvrY
MAQRFLLIDDHPIVRELFKQVLLNTYPHATLVEASTAEEAMSLVSRGAWNLILLDIDLPDRSGLDLLGDIRALVPQAPILVVSGRLEEEFGERALRAGAQGFLSKTCPLKEFNVAVARLCSGKKYISADLASRLLESQLHPTKPTAHAALSSREFEVLRMLGQGRTVSEIAALLNLNVKTVSTYRARVLEKLGLHNTPGIIRYALQHHLEM